MWLSAKFAALRNRTINERCVRAYVHARCVCTPECSCVFVSAHRLGLSECVRPCLFSCIPLRLRALLRLACVRAPVFSRLFSWIIICVRSTTHPSARQHVRVSSIKLVHSHLRPCPCTCTWSCEAYVARALLKRIPNAFPPPDEGMRAHLYDTVSFSQTIFYVISHPI